MKKGQVYEGTIESVEFPNKGRIYLPEEDRWVVVKNGVPGQKVRFSVNKIRKGIVKQEEFLGFYRQYHVETETHENIIVRTDRGVKKEVGKEIQLQVK